MNLGLYDSQLLEFLQDHVGLPFKLSIIFLKIETLSEPKHNLLGFIQRVKGSKGYALTTQFEICVRLLNIHHQSLCPQHPHMGNFTSIGISCIEHGQEFITIERDWAGVVDELEVWQKETLRVCASGA